MFHDVDDLERERQRVTVRPEADSAPPVLALFEVTTAVPVPEYVDRLRAVMGPVISIALAESFDGESVSAETVPEWFRAVSADEGDGEAVPEFARRGRDRYWEEIEEGTWEIQDWLFRFDPESEFRGWAWWDVTLTGESGIHVWVDSWGESFFGCDDLRWLLFTAGAEQVSGPRVVKVLEWAQEIPV